MSNQLLRPKALETDETGPPKTVPYQRFKAVVSERNDARDAAAEKDREIAELKTKLEKSGFAKNDAIRNENLCAQDAALLALLSQFTGVHLQSLYGECRRKILDAAHMLGSDADEVTFLQKHFVRTWDDFDPLTAAFEALQQRYANEIYDAQINLFSIDRIEPKEAYQRFFYHSLMPKLIESPELVINIVRAVGGWPCKNRELAASAVFQFMTEMSLPHPRMRFQPTIYCNN